MSDESDVDEMCRAWCWELKLKHAQHPGLKVFDVLIRTPQEWLFLAVAKRMLSQVSGFVNSAPFGSRFDHRFFKRSLFLCLGERSLDEKCGWIKVVFQTPIIFLVASRIKITSLLSTRLHFLFMVLDSIQLRLNVCSCETVKVNCTHNSLWSLTVVVCSSE